MAAAASASLPFTSIRCNKRQLSFGAGTLNVQQLGGSDSRWHYVSLKSIAPKPRLRAANRAIVARAGTYKVAILGAAGGVGQPLSLLIKMSPLVSELRLYDIVPEVDGVAADLSHCNSQAQVAGFTGKDQLASSLTGADVVVIPAGVPRKPGMAVDDLFSTNAGIVKDRGGPRNWVGPGPQAGARGSNELVPERGTVVHADSKSCAEAFRAAPGATAPAAPGVGPPLVKELAEEVADHAPGALIHIITNPVHSTVPVAAEVLKQKGAYDPRKLFGVTTLNVVRANAFVAARKSLPLADVDVPVVGGHAGATVLPLLSKARPKTAFTDEEVEELTARVRDAGTEVVELKAGEGSATLSAAYAAARFLEASLRGLDGDAGVYECAYVQSQVVPELPFFAARVKLGRDGVEEVVASELKGLSDYEARALEALKPQLKACIDRGVAYVQQQPTSAALN